MSEGLNRVLLLGNLGADGELRVTPGGQAVLKLRLACTESYKDNRGERKDRTEWCRVTVWGKRGEALAKILHKGDRIFVEGRLQTSKYEKNGATQYSTEIVANNVILNGNRGGGAGQSPPHDPDTGEVAEGGASTSSAADDLPFISSLDAISHTERTPLWERW